MIVRSGEVVVHELAPGKRQKAQKLVLDAQLALTDERLTFILADTDRDFLGGENVLDGFA